jgi:hypothetical protein
MTTLSELQAWLAEQFVRPRSLAKYPDVVSAAKQHIVPAAALSAVDRIEIYRQQFWLRHTASLLEDFPGVAGILGQTDWERLSESYLAQHPCRSFNLRDLGDRFAEHIARQDWLPHRTLCHDMARLEWAYVEIFDAADVPPLDGTQLAQLSEHAWQTATFVFNPAVRLLRVDYPVVELRRALRGESDEPVPIPKPEPHPLLLYRGADRVAYPLRMPSLAFALLERLLGGQALAAACEALATEDPNNATTLAADVGGWFAEWGRLRLIAEVRG